MAGTKADQHAIGSLALSILSLCVPTILSCRYPLLAGLLQLAAGVTAVALGVSGRRRVLASNGVFSGEGVAVAGIMIGLVVILSGFLLTIIGINTD